MLAGVSMKDLPAILGHSGMLTAENHHTPSRNHQMLPAGPYKRDGSEGRQAGRCSGRWQQSPETRVHDGTCLRTLQSDFPATSNVPRPKIPGISIGSSPNSSR